MARGRRWIGPLVRLTRRSWEDVAPELEDFLKKLWASEADGIPSGFGNTLPTTVTPGASGSAGAGNTAGWASADHSHPVETGIPSSLANSNQAGTSTKIPRLDHKHKRDVRVQENGVDVGIRNALSFEDSAAINFTVIEDVPNDRLRVQANVSLSSGVTFSESWAKHFMFMGR